MEEIPNKIKHPWNILKLDLQGHFLLDLKNGTNQWLTRFERFRRISGLENITDDVQIDYLLYEMGGKSEEIMNTFQLKKNKK